MELGHKGREAPPPSTKGSDQPSPNHDTLMLLAWPNGDERPSHATSVDEEPLAAGATSQQRYRWRK